MQQGPFAPRALPRFNANTDPAATVSSSIDFPAVLPFDNLDGADALELVAANVTVAITEELAALGVLNVVPRADVLEYKGLAGGARALGRSPRYSASDYVLAGSVERDGINGRLRLQAYFRHAWGSTSYLGRRVLLQRRRGRADPRRAR